MDKKEFTDIFNTLADLNGINNEESSIAESFFTLCSCLTAANKIHNLTAIKEEEGIILKHFIDSLMISELIDEGSSVIDIGCGPGFPSLPLAIYRKDLKILGVDSTSKKINYVSDTARSLGLDNISAISTRAEELGHNAEYRESFDVATARAVASLPVLCELCLPFVRTGGYFIAMKAQNAQEEIAASKNAISKCGGEYIKTVTKLLTPRSPDNESEKRSLIIIKKTKNTPDVYPRMYSKIIKKPL